MTIYIELKINNDTHDKVVVYVFLFYFNSLKIIALELLEMATI